MITKLPTYTAYKNAGEAWIADVPEHWEIKKLKLIFKEKKIDKKADEARRDGVGLLDAYT